MEAAISSSVMETPHQEPKDPTWAWASIFFIWAAAAASLLVSLSLICRAPFVVFGFLSRILSRKRTNNKVKAAANSFARQKNCWAAR
jgi:hypothetical protein